MGSPLSPKDRKQKRDRLFSLFRMTKGSGSIDPTVHRHQQEIKPALSALPAGMVYLGSHPKYNNQDSIDDDDIPLARMMQHQQRRTHQYILPVNTAAGGGDNNGEEDDDDMDLIPIAIALSPTLNSEQHQYKSAAEKYKEKVKKRLAMKNNVRHHTEVEANLQNVGCDDDDDDDIPIIRLLPHGSSAMII